MKQKKIVHRVAFLLLSGGIIYFATQMVKNVFAVFNPDSAVHINASEIEDSTLIIGTHLIHLSAVNDEIYKIAKESVSASAQKEIYYKSELGAGKWYNITNAEGLEDIMEKATPISDEEIHQLYMTHHTKSNGVTYDLRTNRSVSIFDIKKLYEITGLEELDPVWNHHRTTDVSKSKAEIEELQQKNIKTKQTDRYDKQISGLQMYYEALKQRQKPAEWTDTVQRIMGKVDSSRRIIVLNLADNFLTEIEQKEEMDEGLLNVVSDSRKNIAEVLTSQEGNVLSEGNTVMSRLEYSLSLELIAMAEQAQWNEEAADNIVIRLVNLGNIINSKIIDIQGELTVLEEMLPQLETIFTENLARGVVWDISEEDRKAELDTIRNEFQFYIKSKIDRMEKKDAQKYIEECLVNSSKLTQSILEDDMKKAYVNVVESYIQWLNQMLEQNSIGGEKSDIQKKVEEKSALEEKIKGAMDKNRIDDAKRYQALADDKAKEIKASESEINKKIKALEEQKKISNVNEKGEIEKEIAILKKQLPEDSESKNIQEMKNKTLEILREGQAASKEKDIIALQVEGLGAILEGGSPAAGEALKEIYKKIISESFLNDDTEMEDIIVRIEDLITENNEVIKESSLTEESAAKAIQEIIGGEGEEEVNFEETAGEDLSAALAALSECGEEAGNSVLNSLAANMAQSLYESNREDMDLFPYYIGAAADYVPVSAVAKYLKYRYVWSDSKKTAIMSRGADYYSFTAFDKRYTHADEETQQLTSATDFRGEVYIPAAFVEIEFHCKIYPLAKSGYAIIMKDEIEKKAEEMKDVLLEKGENEWRQQ